MINLGDINFQTVTTRTIGWNKKLYFNPGLHYLNGQLIRKQVPDNMGMQFSNLGSNVPSFLTESFSMD